MVSKIIIMILIVGMSIQAYGQEIATADQSDVCSHVEGTYSKRHRGVLSISERKNDFVRAGIAWIDHTKYELDHTVPLALGGADTPANRHPQPCSRWAGHRCIAGEAYRKDILEDRDARWVCSGRDRLQKAQSHYVTLDSWRAAFKHVFGVDP